MVRIMIAEDSDATRIFLKEIVINGKHEIVAEAADGIDAIEKLNFSNPEVLLLDYNLPKKDGLNIIREIRAAHKHTKIVMITASDDQKLIENCINAGALAHITKPFETDTVLKAISYALAD